MPYELYFDPSFELAKSNCEFVFCDAEIRDVRPSKHELQLDRDGIQYCDWETDLRPTASQLEDSRTSDAIIEAVVADSASLLKTIVVADEIVCFDWRVSLYQKSQRV